MEKFNGRQGTRHGKKNPNLCMVSGPIGLHTTKKIIYRFWPSYELLATRVAPRSVSRSMSTYILVKLPRVLCEC